MSLHTLNTIKVFLASSEEMTEDRIAISDFVRRLNLIYEKFGICIKLFMWESCDLAYNDRPQQEAYNDQVRKCDMFIALFRTKLGKYTIQEFEVALEEFHRTNKTPRIYIWIRDLNEGEKDDSKLLAFKHRLNNELGYYFSGYNNIDSLQLNFYFQLQSLLNVRIEKLNVENGIIKLDNEDIANLDNVRFIADNNELKSLTKKNTQLQEQIERALFYSGSHPNDKNVYDELQKLLRERNELQKYIDQQQQLLLNTAIRINQLQGENIPERMRRAMKAFEEGDVREANIILDEAEHDAYLSLNNYLNSKERVAEIRKKVIISIEELLLKASTLMAVSKIPIDKRKEQAKKLYNTADLYAIEIDYEKEKHLHLLFDYAIFLSKYGFFEEAKEIYLRQISLAEIVFGRNSTKTAISYNNLGSVYKQQSEYGNALDYYFKALEISKNTFGEDNPFTVTLYNNIGSVYDNQGNYKKAIEYYSNALNIYTNTLGLENHNTATAFNNIGGVFYELGEYEKALESHQKALTIRHKIYGKEHLSIAQSYNNIGLVYDIKSDYEEAAKYYFLSLEIKEKILGEQHPSTAISYNNIGGVYYKLNKFDEALKYHFKALKVREKTFGANHPETATSYNNIGLVYKSQKKYDDALKYYLKDMNICEKVFGKEHPNTAISYSNIGSVYDELDKYDDALKYYFNALTIKETALGAEHLDTSITYNNIGSVYYKKEEFNAALYYFTKAYQIRLNKLGLKHPDTKDVENRINIVKKALGQIQC